MEVTMQSLETRPITPLAPVSGIAWLVLGGFVNSAAAKLRRCIRAQYDTFPAPDGYAWTDSLEREVNDHAAMCRRLRF
jgi:hypothetical protein